MELDLLEEEIQVIVALLELEMPIETPHNNHYSFCPKDITEASSYFHRNLLPWDSAYTTLLEKRLISTVLRYKKAFLAEGNRFLFDNLLMESVKAKTSYNKDTCHIKRYLYIARK